MKKIDLKSLILGTPKRVTELSADDSANLLPVKEIRDGVITLKNGKMLTVIEVLPLNFHLKSEIEKRNIISGFFSWLKIAPQTVQFYIRTGQANIDTFCQRLEEYYKNEHNENCRQMIYEDAKLTNDIAENEAVTRRFYIVLPYEGNLTEHTDIANELAETVFTAKQYLESFGLEIAERKDTDVFLFELLYGILRPDTAGTVSVSELFGKLNGETSEDTSLEDMLSPDTVNLKNKDYIEIENAFCSTLYLSGAGYPTVMGPAWLSPLVESGNGISVSFTLERIQRDKILPKIGNVTRWNRARMQDVGDTRSDFEQLDDAIESGLYMKNQINREGEDFYYMHTLLSVTAEDYETLKLREKALINLCGSMNLTVRKADYMQQTAFLSSLPLLNLDKDLALKSRRNILSSGAATAFPFSSYEMCDETGVFYGLNLQNGSTVIIDHYDTSRYSNGNMAVFGMSGAGKTFFLLLTAMRLRMQGVETYIITPEKGFEYRYACEAVGGKFVQIGAGSADCINLMEIRRTTLDIDADIKENEWDRHSVLLDKIQSLHIFFDLLYPNITPDEKYLLDKSVMECYAQFGITKNNRSLKDRNGNIKRMPCFADLITFMEEYKQLASITLALKRLVEGSASGLGGQTNIDLNAPFIVLDTSRLGKEFTALGTFIATEYVRDRISLSRVNKKAIILDEAWKIAGETGNEQAADFVIELVKTVRGYGSIFISATQNVADYFALNDGKFGDALLGNSRLKLLLQLEETEAVKLQEKLNLTENEMLQIVRSGRGQGLLCAGSNRIAVEIRSSKTEYDLITTNRADLEKRVAGKKEGKNEQRNNS